MHFEEKKIFYTNNCQISKKKICGLFLLSFKFLCESLTHLFYLTKEFDLNRQRQITSKNKKF